MELRHSHLLAPLLFLAAAAPAGAFDIFLDHNTDNDPTTFVNLVEGPVSAPVDLIVTFDVADLGVTSLSAVVQWGYGPPDPGGSQGCFDAIGSIVYVPWTPLPDQGPFTNVVPFTCVCRFRCQCDAEMFIQADVTGLTQPGSFVLATLDFSRVGSSIANCGLPTTWAQSDFEVFCQFPVCASPGDPRTKMTITDGSTAVESSSWGKVKALYQ